MKIKLNATITIEGATKAPPVSHEEQIAGIKECFEDAFGEGVEVRGKFPEFIITAEAEVAEPIDDA